MFIIRFLGRGLFTVALLIALVIALAGFLVLGALGLASVLYLAGGIFFGLAYAIRQTPDMAKAALTMLGSSLGCFIVLVGLEGMVWDSFRAIRKRLAPAGNPQLRLVNESFEEDHPFK